METKVFPKGYEDSICIIGVISFQSLLVFGHSASDGACGHFAGVHAGAVTPSVGEPGSKLSCPIPHSGYPRFLRRRALLLFLSDIQLHIGHCVDWTLPRRLRSQAWSKGFVKGNDRKVLV